jgi:hypothetical protein
MSRQVYPDDAERALAEIERRHGQVVDLLTIPGWYWPTIGVLMVGIGFAADSRNPVAIGIAVPVFVLGVGLASVKLALGVRRGAQPRRDLVDPASVLAILGFVAVTIGLSLGVAFTVRAVGWPLPGTWGVTITAVSLVIGGPWLNRYLRHRMLLNRAGKR